ncbi:hypothetical protein COBT_001916 [Conglomerata obtusa]
MQHNYRQSSGQILNAYESHTFFVSRLNKMFICFVFLVGTAICSTDLPDITTIPSTSNTHRNPPSLNTAQQNYPNKPVNNTETEYNTAQGMTVINKPYKRVEKIFLASDIKSSTNIANEHQISDHMQPTKNKNHAANETASTDFRYNIMTQTRILNTNSDLAFHSKLPTDQNCSQKRKSEFTNVVSSHNVKKTNAEAAINSLSNNLQTSMFETNITIPNQHDHASFQHNQSNSSNDKRILYVDQYNKQGLNNENTDRVNKNRTITDVQHSQENDCIELLMEHNELYSGNLIQQSENMVNYIQSLQDQNSINPIHDEQVNDDFSVFIYTTSNPAHKTSYQIETTQSKLRNTSTSNFTDVFTGVLPSFEFIDVETIVEVEPTCEKPLHYLVQNYNTALDNNIHVNEGVITNNPLEPDIYSSMPFPENSQPILSDSNMQKQSSPFLLRDLTRKQIEEINLALQKRSSYADYKQKIEQIYRSTSLNNPMLMNTPQAYLESVYDTHVKVDEAVETNNLQTLQDLYTSDMLYTEFLYGPYDHVLEKKNNDIHELCYYDNNSGSFVKIFTDFIFYHIRNSYLEILNLLVREKNIQSICGVVNQDDIVAIIKKCENELEFIDLDIKKGFRIMRTKIIENQEFKDLRGIKFFEFSTSEVLRDFTKKHATSFISVVNFVNDCILSKVFNFNTFYNVFKQEADKIENVDVQGEIMIELKNFICCLSSKIHIDNIILFPALALFEYYNFIITNDKLPKESQKLFLIISMAYTLETYLSKPHPVKTIEYTNYEKSIGGINTFYILYEINLIETEIIKILLYVIYPIISRDTLKRIITYSVCEKISFMEHYYIFRQNNLLTMNFCQNQIKRQLFLRSFLFYDDDIFLSIFRSYEEVHNDDMITKFYSKMYFYEELKKTLNHKCKFKIILPLLQEHERRLLFSIRHKSPSLYIEMLQEFDLQPNLLISEVMSGSDDTDDALNQIIHFNNIKKCCERIYNINRFVYGKIVNIPNFDLV